MNFPDHSFQHNLYRVFFSVVSIAIILMFCSLIPTPAYTHSADTSPNTQNSSLRYDSPNLVSNGLMSAGNKLEQAANATEAFLTSFALSSVRIASYAGKGLVSGLQSGSMATINGIAPAGRWLAESAIDRTKSVATLYGRTISLPAKAPVALMRTVVDSPAVSAAIKPAADTPTPVIEATGGGSSFPLISAAAALPPSSPGATVPPGPASDTTAIWPIHGQVTTLFGVPHWPYQPTHTAIDISDGTISGITPIRPFKPGRVINVVSSNVGLGNHVVVDHGGGVTSVYAHLYSINATVGQVVDANSNLGTEGSTGASTGTHLHFEIRVNGVPKNPYDFIQGQP